MRKFAMLPTHIFTDDLIRERGADCLLVATYLHGSQHSNIIGLYYLPPVYLANDTCLDVGIVMAHLLYLADIGFCEYDQKSNYVWLRQQMISEIGAEMKPDDNRVKGIIKLLDTLPRNALVQRFIDEFTLPYHLDSKGASKGATKPVTVTETVTLPNHPLAPVSTESEEMIESGVAV